MLGLCSLGPCVLCSGPDGTGSASRLTHSQPMKPPACFLDCSEEVTSMSMAFYASLASFLGHASIFCPLAFEWLFISLIRHVLRIFSMASVSSGV